MVSQMSKTIPILLIGIILSACAGIPASAPLPESVGTPTNQSNTACSSPTNWSIRYNRSGGFAGFNESLTLDSAGRLTVQSERPPVDKQKMITDVQVDAITDLLVEACPFETPSDRGVCADCFIYDLEIIMDGQLHSVQASDVTLTEKLQPLVEVLNQFLQDSRQ
jgi:hypothetical protein